MPSRLNHLYDIYTLGDLKSRVSLRTDEFVVTHNQFYETMQLVVTAALGGKPKVTVVETADQAVQAFNDMLGG